MIILDKSQKQKFNKTYKDVYWDTKDFITIKEKDYLKHWIREAIVKDKIQLLRFDLHPILYRLDTAKIIIEDMNLKRSGFIALMLLEVVLSGTLTVDKVRKDMGDEVATILRGLVKTRELYVKSPVIESENFRNLLLSFAEDMRVILIMIADRVNLMRAINNHPNDEKRKRVANETAYLYAPLAHKLGLYQLKSELEDMSLKYLEREMYQDIKEKLNETKAKRDAYIEKFISPIKEKLEKEGVKFSIKGRTKSIYSIWNKMVRQQTPFERIFDLFAIRIILDTPYEREKQECWQAFSICTDMYKPNPNRLRDWLSVPKSNGYESLHTTVMGPEGRWVEIQIRTQRMDEVAERGVAAHWRYKGVKGETGLDGWLTSMREALENQDTEGDPNEQGRDVMDQFKMDLYEDEVFVFTPKGDLYKLAKGATVLDYAFRIHSRLGCQCTGAIVNNKHAQIRQVLQSGDQVEILTSSTQQPKRDWLNIATTSKARTKIRQSIKELAARYVAFGKEEIERKFKNRKIEYDDKVMMRVIKKMNRKTATEFYQDLGEGTLSVNEVLDQYLRIQDLLANPQQDLSRTADNYNVVANSLPEDNEGHIKEDILVIDNQLKGIDFTLSKCCNPIYGDDVFGFVTINEGIKIHRNDCPNAPQLRERYGYRIVPARWAGKSTGKTYPITLRIIGQDDIGIVTNITSLISKEGGITLRSINVNSNDGLFSGTLTVMVSSQTILKGLIKKIKGVKGIKQVIR
ncbi:MAG: RelA/SpoT family protein [Bacteroidaceae bacterium]